MIKYIFLLIFLISYSHDLKASDLDAKNYSNKARLIIVDRTAGNGKKIDVNNNEIMLYKNIEISFYNCWKSPKNKNESAALVKIEQIVPSEKYEKELSSQKNLSSSARKRINPNANKTNPDSFTTKKIFSGWLLSNYRYVTTIEHPIYDFWLDKCL